jgi:hypothetical protein
MGQILVNVPFGLSTNTTHETKIELGREEFSQLVNQSAGHLVALSVSRSLVLQLKNQQNFK